MAAAVPENLPAAEPDLFVSAFYRSNPAAEIHQSSKRKVAAVCIQTELTTAAAVMIAAATGVTAADFEESLCAFRKNGKSYC